MGSKKGLQRLSGCVLGLEKSCNSHFYGGKMREVIHCDCWWLDEYSMLFLFQKIYFQNIQVPHRNSSIVCNGGPTTFFLHSHVFSQYIVTTRVWVVWWTLKPEPERCDDRASKYKPMPSRAFKKHFNEGHHSRSTYETRRWFRFNTDSFLIKLLWQCAGIRWLQEFNNTSNILKCRASMTKFRTIFSAFCGQKRICWTYPTFLIIPE